MPTVMDQTMVAYQPMAVPSKLPAMGSHGYEPTTAVDSDLHSSSSELQSLHSRVPAPSFAPPDTGTDGQEDGFQTPSSLDDPLFRFSMENDDQMESDNVAALGAMLNKLESATVREDGVGPHSNEEFKKAQSAFDATRAAMSALARSYLRQSRNPYGILEQDLSVPYRDDDSSSADTNYVREKGALILVAIAFLLLTEC